MTIGILAALTLKKWLRSEVRANVIFSIVANSLAMMAAHDLLPQRAGKGWIGSNNQEKRIGQLIWALKKYKKYKPRIAPS